MADIWELPEVTKRVKNATQTSNSIAFVQVHLIVIFLLTFTAHPNFKKISVLEISMCPFRIAYTLVLRIFVLD
jgi:hypothetical protein